MAKVCGCNGKGQHKKLTCPPGNLKECIDWILRVTNKDGQQNGGDCKKLGEEVAKLLEEAQKDAKAKLEKDKNLLEAVKQKLKDGTLIKDLAEKLQKFIGWKDGNGDLTGDGIGNSNGGKGGGGTNNKYESSYKDANWEQCNSDHITCATIFLGTIPVIFSGLTYLYWQCNESGQRWCKGMYKIHDTSNALGIYFVCCGYDSKQLNRKGSGGIDNITGDYIAGLLNNVPEFNEFSSLDGGTSTQVSYSAFIGGLLKHSGCYAKEATTEGFTTHPLSWLYICSTYYFQSQFNNAGTHVPTTIREMLYWLMALPYSGCFPLATEDIKQGIDNITENADISGEENGGSDSIEFIVGPTLKDSDPFDCYLSTSCHYAGVVLCTIQGTLITNGMTKTVNKKLTLTDIYSNTAFNFNYPTTANALFRVLWDIIYFLLSQLYFLKRQCKFPWGNGRGWQYCRYGGDVKCVGCSSWICTAKCGTHSTNGKCNQPQQHTNNCGQPGFPSPLQAFLCDLLTPFKCPKSGETQKYPPYTDHVSHRQFHLYCPVPMGFNKDCLSQSPRNGNCIFWVLDYFTQDKNDRESVSLDNTIICLICCSLRTPRTVGDLFSFFLHAGLFLYLGGSSSSVATAIETASQDMPQTPNTECKQITTALNKLAGKKHNGKHTADADLYTLYNSECDNPNTCGNYLQSLSYSIYCNISTTFAMSYLSLIVYLTDVLKKGLQSLLDDFRKLQCTDCHHGIKKCDNDCHYPEKPKMEQRELLKLKFPPAQNKPCSCPSIVQCHGTLSLLYQYGFVYYKHSALNGQPSNQTKKLRKCKDFCIELQKLLFQSVLFRELLDAINAFLYCIRKPFLLYLLTFYLLAIIYLTYSLTIPLDVLHLRSHLRTAVLSPLVLLTNYTQPHDITYFKP
ncbi:uncharacterized protein BXIN_1820 [Babesia sp. Xinjiang]|uniref:uncharacterized protein n=1 Tax=Babesia sp. Xinjiang TaxID=462227 RepID=UPI000A2470BA|nr:uncharacterized protein BXIN_1820 [Babesia sp. Xinjiang]ORM40635.1 hypothetical protein BXIN_1820 [Babesia sp. Xinjiang]